jgi:hypothetical protein
MDSDANALNRHGGDAEPPSVRAAPWRRSVRVSERYGKVFLVCGGRDYADRDLVWLTLESAELHGPGISKIICGYDPKNPKFQGADQLAYEWAMAVDIPVTPFPADWKKYRRAAGPIRNQQMADERPDICLAFKGGDGTADMRGRAAKAGIEVVMVEPRS